MRLLGSRECNNRRVFWSLQKLYIKLRLMLVPLIILLWYRNMMYVTFPHRIPVARNESGMEVAFTVR